MSLLRQDKYRRIPQIYLSQRGKETHRLPWPSPFFYPRYAGSASALLYYLRIIVL